MKNKKPMFVFIGDPKKKKPRNPYGRRGKPSFMRSVVRGLKNFLKSPFNS